jgi:hypothetical protein
VVGRPKQLHNGLVSSVRQAAAACNVSPPVVRRWLSLGLIPEPPCTREHSKRFATLPTPRVEVLAVVLPTAAMTGWNAGCRCAECRQFQSERVRARGRCKAQDRLPADVRRQLLHVVNAGKQFRQALRDLGLTSNQVWGFTKTEEEW